MKILPLFPSFTQRRFLRLRVTFNEGANRATLNPRDDWGDRRNMELNVDADNFSGALRAPRKKIRTIAKMNQPMVKH
jgi:hypothetical protein